MTDIIDEAKAETWTKGVEVALLRIVDGRRLLVSGGADGIELTVQTGIGVIIRLESVEVRVVELCWHTHLRVTGPSDWDRIVLELLGQELSTIYEINGEPNVTMYRRANWNRA
jgi:hypothetical protein